MFHLDLDFRKLSTGALCSSGKRLPLRHSYDSEEKMPPGFKAYLRLSEACLGLAAAAAAAFRLMGQKSSVELCVELV